LDRDRRSEGERGCARVNGDLCVSLMSDSRHSLPSVEMRSAARWAVVVVCLALAACGNSPSFDEFGSDLDKLALPDTWQLAGSVTYGRGGDIECEPIVGSPFCPNVSRYYVAEGTTRDVYDQAADMVVGAGFTLELTGRDPCDRLEGMSLCSVQGVTDDRKLWVQVWPPDAEFTGIQIEGATGPIVSVTVWRNVTK